MDDKQERALLIQEILILEAAIGISTPDQSFFDNLTIAELRAMRIRVDRLARSLGGLRGNQ